MVGIPGPLVWYARTLVGEGLAGGGGGELSSSYTAVVRLQSGVSMKPETAVGGQPGPVRHSRYYTRAQDGGGADGRTPGRCLMYNLLYNSNIIRL